MIDSIPVLSVKDPAESIIVTLDFSAMLPAGVTITRATAACTVVGGQDPNPSAMLSGALSSSGSQVLIPVSGGLSGVYYEIKATVSTSNAGIVRVFGAILPVRTQ